MALMNAAAAFVDDSLETLAALSTGAGRMSEAFMAKAEAAADPEAERAYTDLFLRAAQAFRLGLALTLKIMHPGPIRIPGDLDVREAMRDRAAHREPRDRDDERDREGDYEPVSLPRFLSTLRGVTQAAEARADQLPADVRETLPALKDLLAKAKAEAAPAQKPAAPLAVLARPAAPLAPNARSRLLGSASAPLPPPLRDSS
jgi:hypothetical protein